MENHDAAEAMHDAGEELEGDEQNPAFQAPMQLLRPSACHTFLEPVPDTITALRQIEDPLVRPAPHSPWASS